VHEVARSRLEVLVAQQGTHAPLDDEAVLVLVAVAMQRGQWHTFWNAGDEPCRILEIISPAGFERFFAELVDMGGVTQADPETMGALCARYGLEMDPGSVPGLVERFGLRFPGDPL